MSKPQKSTNPSPTDLSVFKSIINPPKTCNEYQFCPALLRLAVALKYYTNLDITNNEPHKDILIDFMSNVYKNMIEDYIHLHKQHGHQIEEINNYFINDQKFTQCQMAKCNLTSRHHRVTTSHRHTNHRHDKNDEIIKFYKETFDSLHFYIFHIFDAGLRVLSGALSADIAEETGEQDDRKDDEYFDIAFSNVTNSLSDKRENIDSFQRFGRGTNSKFNIKTEYDANNDDYIENETDEYNETFIDALCNELLSNGIDLRIIRDLQKYLQNEEYDTDPLAIDISNFGQKGNILNHVNDEKSVKQINSFLKSAEKSVGAFSIGLRFYYWDFYKNLDESPVDERKYGFMKDHSGYKISQLYINKHYGSFQEEILNYNSADMDIEQYKLFMIKAKRFINTEYAKSSRCRVTGYGPKHYGIDQESALKPDHLLSIILYTDTTKLSADFSASFRKNHQYETLSQIKKRNSKYYWWSKNLRETVELYGSYINSDGIKGPFYTGISVSMTMPSFSLRLCSPTSTSVHMAVAVTFSGNKGLILQLKGEGMLDFHHNFGTTFDVSWISQFKEEDERLFIGGWNCIAVESIRIMKGCKNYKLITETLFCFDSLISGNNVARKCWKKITKKHEELLRHLIDNYLNNKECDKKLDKYAYDTFECFVNHKDHIYITLQSFEDEYASDMMKHLVVDRVEIKYVEEPREFDDMTNLPRKELLELFKPKRITIRYKPKVYKAYMISFRALLSVIKDYEIQEIKFELGKAKGYKKLNRMHPISSELREAYNSANYELSDLIKNQSLKKTQCDIKYKF